MSWATSIHFNTAARVHALTLINVRCETQVDQRSTGADLLGPPGLSSALGHFRHDAA